MPKKAKPRSRGIATLAVFLLLLFLTLLTSASAAGEDSPMSSVSIARPFAARATSFVGISSRKRSRRLPRQAISSSLVFAQRQFSSFLRGGGGDQTRRSTEAGDSSTNDGGNSHRHPNERRRITYLTDVEGDRDYLTRYVEQSKVLCFRPCSSVAAADDERDDVTFDFPYDHCIDFIERRNNNSKMNNKDLLVYGGDVWDQGGSDLYVIRQLLHLKARYPESVHIVMGNRDINKMRLVRELQTENDENDGLAPHSYGVYWFRGTGLMGDPELREPLSRCPVERLQWILRRTMGSPRAFQHRKDELERLALEKSPLGDPAVTITDHDVVKSYQESTLPNGEMGQYLAHAQLAVRLGEVLFVHGALPLTDVNLRHGYRADFWDDPTFAMPWLPPNVTARDVGVETIDDWLRALNDFAAKNVKAFQTHPYKGEMYCQHGGYNFTNMQPYAQLIQYGTFRSPDIGRNPTIVYNSWCHNGMPRKFFPDAPNDVDSAFAQVTRDFLDRSGIALICSGHQPQGDMPNPIRIPLLQKNRTSWILSCDTSYSGDTTFLNLPQDENTTTKTTTERTNPGREGSRSGRGMRAVSEVLIEQCVKTGKVLDVHCHGVLADGSKYRTASLDFSGTTASLPNEATDNNDGRPIRIGEIAPASYAPSPEDSPHGDVWWTRAAFVDETNGFKAHSYLLATGEGFDFWNRIDECSEGHDVL